MDGCVREQLYIVIGVDLETKFVQILSSDLDALIAIEKATLKKQSNLDYVVYNWCGSTTLKQAFLQIGMAKEEAEQMNWEIELFLLRKSFE